MKFPISENVNKSLEQAHFVAKKYSNPDVGTEHVLYGLTVVEESVAGKLLREAGVDPVKLEKFFEQSEHVILTDPMLTLRVRQTLLNATRISQQLGNTVLTSEYLLFALLQDKTSAAYNILVNAFNVDVTRILQALQSNFTRNGQVSTSENTPTSQLPAQLRDLGIDLTARAREHKIDPIIGRKDEIERIIQILCRKTKNNPVLIGEPGVGKSAVVEGLSRAIVEGDVPELLKNKIVFSLDLGSLMAGTKYRGALEEKLKDAIDLIKSQQNIIVFIDELHTLAQAGSKEGEVSPADILKPYLARGELQTIGATTTDEYRKYIEKDKALERRFQPVIVAPPGIDDTIEILRGLRENYETFHKVKISDEALVAAAKLSDRYITDRFLPDKAIDLIDEAMSKAKVNENTVPSELKSLEDQLQEFEVKKQEALRHEDYVLAGKIRDERNALSQKIDELKVNWSKNSERSSIVIGEEEIAEIVSKWTKIPVTKLTETETERLINLENILHKRVIGQDTAVQSVSKAIRRARAGLKDPGRPVGTFLFLGPTGVGKTELTKALSEAMFDDENSIIRLDMSEYMEAHSVSKMVGSPPGYVGHEEGGQLTEQVRRKPYSVVLFDEIEKAHPDVYNILLQILDDGRLTDSQGRVVNFKNTIIIMTSNVGVSDLKGNRTLGFSSSKTVDEQKTEEILGDALKRHFKPEFLNRIDVICFFHHLSKEDITKIAEILLEKVRKSLDEKGIKLSLTNNVIDYIVTRGYDPEYGARPLRRVIEQTIDDNIAEALLNGKIQKGNTATVDVKDGKVIVY